MKINFKSFLLSSAIAITFSACYYDNLEDLHPAPVIIPGVNDTTAAGCDTAKTITYTADIKPIMSNNCGAGNNSCHSGSGSQSGIDLSTYAGSKGAALGNLVGAITWDGTAPNMPKNLPKINDCSIAIIKKWVNTGTAE
jgi:hypothetical protein